MRKANSLQPWELETGSKQLFVGGLLPNVSEQELRDYFEEYGDLWECRLMTYKDGKSRGFGFVQFLNKNSMDFVLKQRRGLKIRGKLMDCKIALTKDESNHKISEDLQKKLFVGNLTLETTESDLEEVFIQFGDVVKTRIIYHQHTMVSRGFGFVTFATQEAVDAALHKTPILVNEAVVELKRAVSKIKIEEHYSQNQPSGSEIEKSYSPQRSNRSFGKLEQMSLGGLKTKKTQKTGTDRFPAQNQILLSFPSSPKKKTLISFISNEPAQSNNPIQHYEEGNYRMNIRTTRGSPESHKAFALFSQSPSLSPDSQYSNRPPKPKQPVISSKNPLKLSPVRGSYNPYGN